MAGSGRVKSCDGRHWRGMIGSRDKVSTEYAGGSEAIQGKEHALVSREQSKTRIGLGLGLGPRIGRPARVGASLA
jgi:hypothetical protein